MKENRLNKIMDHIDATLEFVKNVKTYSDFVNNRMLRDACLLNVQQSDQTFYHNIGHYPLNVTYAAISS